MSNQTKISIEVTKYATHFSYELKTPAGIYGIHDEDKLLSEVKRVLQTCKKVASTDKEIKKRELKSKRVYVGAMKHIEKLTQSDKKAVK